MRDFDPTAGEYAGQDWSPKSGRLYDIGSVFSVGSSILGGILGDDSNEDAAQTQADATDRANKITWDMYSQTREDNMPALQARNNALARMQELLGVGGNSRAAGYGSLNTGLKTSDVMSEPGYQFGLQQGQQALARQNAARGMYNSGAALKAAQRYGTDYATTKYDNAFNRLQTQQTNQFNRLSGLAGNGSVGANTVASAGQNAANNVANNTTALGNAQAASQLSSGNNWTNAIGQIGGWAANKFF